MYIYLSALTLLAARGQWSYFSNILGKFLGLHLSIVSQLRSGKSFFCLIWKMTRVFYKDSFYVMRMMQALSKAF